MSRTYTVHKRKLKQRLNNLLMAAGLDAIKRVDSHEFKRFVAKLGPVAVSTPLIRVGGESDGGYLIPDDLEGVAAVISPGVGPEVSFDLAMASRGVDIFMFDASVPGPPVPSERFHFAPLYLDVFDSERTVTLESATEAAGVTADLVLEMDIEGAEYRVLNATPKHVIERFRIIALELHDLRSTTIPHRLADISACLDRLRQTHDIVHAHPNNCGSEFKYAGLTIPETIEITLWRKDRSDVLPGSRPRLPHALDRDCSSLYPSLNYPASWLTSG